MVRVSQFLLVSQSALVCGIDYDLSKMIYQQQRELASKYILISERQHRIYSTEKTTDLHAWAWLRTLWKIEGRAS